MSHQKPSQPVPPPRSLTSRDVAWSAFVALVWVLASYLLVTLWLLPVNLVLAS